MLFAYDWQQILINNFLFARTSLYKSKTLILLFGGVDCI